MCKTYYVDPQTGRDTNDGLTPEKPLATLFAVNRLALAPGGTVLLKCGSVFEKQFLHLRCCGKKDSPITIAAYGEGPAPRIDADGQGLWYQDYGCALDAPTHVYRGYVSSAVLLYDAAYVTVRDLELTNRADAVIGEQYSQPDKLERTGVAVVAKDRGTRCGITLQNLLIHDVHGNVYDKHMNNGGIYMTALQPADETATGAAHQAESRVGHVFHRGKQYRVLAEVYILNLHNLTGFGCKNTEKRLPLRKIRYECNNTNRFVMSSITDFEIMAPVGSRESLAAAIQAGADSIYFGIENLNMRARSANTFTIDDLREIAQTCDEHGMKSYLTVNTIIYDNDIPLMRTIVDAAKAAGISAVIAADVAVMSYARQIGQEVHLSTQLNISNVEALRFYAQFADVVVLARELNLEQVAEIYRHIREENICGPGGEQIRIEMFCHGALCMAVSGKCYLSLHEMNHSANRGACMQVCRRSYTVRDKETDVELDIDNQYIMSPKDLKTIHFMNKMLDAGVRVFKIEGRARGPEYVRTVVECYKEAIRSYVEGTFTDEKIAVWDERLKTVFNRGFWDGYYLGQRLGEWTRNYGSAATERKIYVGKGIRYFSNIGVAEFLVEAAEVNVGDKLLITGPTTGAVFTTLEEARVDLKPVQTVRKGQHFSMKADKIRPSDKLYKLVSVEELKKFKGLDIENKRG